MTPRFIERHQDYVLKIASLAAGQIMTAMPVVLDLDAPFVLRSRAFRVVPNQNNVQVGLQYLKTSFTGPDENYVSQQRVPATLHSYCFGQQGSPTPVFPQRIYPAGGIIYVDVENTGAGTLTNLRLYFRGVKLYPWGSRPAVTYANNHGPIRPFCYPVVASQLPVTTTAPLVVPFIMQPDADFVLRGGRAGPRNSAPSANSDPQAAPHEQSLQPCLRKPAARLHAGDDLLQRVHRARDGLAAPPDLDHGQRHEGARGPHRRGGAPH